jgi:DUF1365 family protein
MRSRLYVGEVLHRRVTEPQHQFRYRVYYHLFDLDELDALDRRLRLFGYRRTRPVRFRGAQMVGVAGRPVSENIREYLQGQGVTVSVARIELLTQCRVLGFVFNPVSFFYCFGADGRLVAVVAEVHNTFGERHCYLLRAGDAVAGNHWHEKKVFHVSPFMTLAGTYEFEMGIPGERLDIRIDLSRGGSTVFTSRLALEARPLTDRALAGMLVRYPLMPHAVLVAIHRQALALWRKGLTYYPKPPYDPEAARGGER